MHVNYVNTNDKDKRKFNLLNKAINPINIQIYCKCILIYNLMQLELQIVVIVRSDTNVSFSHAISIIISYNQIVGH